jgi:hypothetical protein
LEKNIKYDIAPLGYLQIALIILKAGNWTSWSWLIILIPVWIGLFGLVIGLIILLFVYLKGR